MSEKNALAILGSPHTNGMTAAMLNFAVHKPEQASYAVTKITLLGTAMEETNTFPKPRLRGEAIYDFDFLQYSRAFFVDIRTKQRGNPQYGRIFQDRRREVDGKSGMCKCKE